MKTSLKNKEFYIETYEFYSHLIQFCENVSQELKDIAFDYNQDKINDIVDSFSIAAKRIAKFIDKWEDDDDKVCNVLKTAKKFFEYYGETLRDTISATLSVDVKYIFDSIKTTKLTLSVKLKNVKKYNEN